MSIFKHWHVPFILSFILLSFGVIFLFPSISIYIISVFMSIFLLLYYILKVVPKYRRLKNVNSEWVMWIVIESIILICSALLSLLTPKIIIDIYIFKFNLSNLFGLVLVTEGLVGIIRLCNLIYIKNLIYKPKKILKYIYIIVIICGSYILFNNTINNEYLSYILSVFCFIGFLVFLIYSVKIRKTKKQSKNLEAINS